MIRIVIDLNVRVANNETYAGFEDIVGNTVPTEGSAVEVVERESGLIGQASVTRIDSAARLVYLAVDWLSMRAVRPPRKAVAVFSSAITSTSAEVDLLSIMKAHNSAEPPVPLGAGRSTVGERQQDSRLVYAD